MAAGAAKIRGGKVEIRKEHIEIYKITHFQNSRKTFQVKLPNDCTILYFRKKLATEIKMSGFF
jgi:hypothetical protein